MDIRVAHISSVTNSLLSSQAISNVNSKNSKTVGKKGGARIARRKRRELNDATNKKSPQPEASFKEDINIEDVIPSHDHNECIEEEGHDHNKCIEEEEDAKMMWMMLSLQNKFSRKRESPQDDCISILEQQKVPGSPQSSSSESIELDEFSGWVDYTMEGSSPPATP